MGSFEGGNRSIKFEGAPVSALSAVRAELRAAFVAFVVGFLIAFYALRLWIWPTLARNLLESSAVVVAVTPFDVILLQAKLALIGGLLVALALVAYRSRRGLRARGLALPGSKRTHALVGLLAVGQFVGGVAYAHLVFLPLLFDFLVSNAVASGFQPTYSVVEWTQFILLLTVALGLTAELPLVMGGLAYAEVVSDDLFREKWRHAVFAIVVISSMVNGSPDPFSMSLVAIPMITLYLVGLVCARFVTSMQSSRVPPASDDPATLDLADLDAAGVRAAPPEAVEALTEHEALALADAAVDAGDREKAAAILERFDELGGPPEPSETSSAPRLDVTGTVERTAAGMADAFTEDETTEEDIGGYYYDLRFVLDSLSSKMFRIVGPFVVVTGATFTFLYRGGIEILKRDFLTELPASVRPSAVDIVLLHPVEALAFEMKVSLVVGTVAVLPLALYYAWPAATDRGLVRGDRDVFLVWAVVLGLGLFVGGGVGYRYVAPALTSYLVADALAADMILAYRVSAFFWLIFATTVGVGLLVEVPLTMLLFDRGGVVRYRTMRTRWREFVVGALVAASLLPGGLLVMILVGTAVSLVYGVGLGCLWLVTLGGRLARSTGT